MTTLRDSYIILSAIVVISAGATGVVMYNDLMTTRQVEKSGQVEHDALVATAQALRVRIDNKIRIIGDLRSKCEDPAPAPAPVVADTKPEPKPEPKTIYVYKAKPAISCPKPSAFCQSIGC